MNNALVFIRRYSAPFLWAVGVLCALMLLSVYDAEAFLCAFVVTVLGVFGVFLALPNREVLEVPCSPFLALLLVFWALVFNSVLFSENSYTSFIFFCFLSILPLSFIYASLMPDKDRFFGAVFKIGAGVFAVLSVLCLWQYFLLPEILPHGRTQYPFGNPNSLAGYLSLGFFCAYGAAINAQGRYSRLAGFALALLIFAGLLTTGSRGAFLALLGGIGVLSVLLRAPVLKDWKNHAAFWGLALLFFLALSGFAPEINKQTPGDIVKGSVSGEIPLLWDRPALWLSTWHIIQDHFWTGIGAGTFFQVYPSYRVGDVGTAGHMAHNDLLQFWAEMGVFAPLVFIALCGFAALKTLGALRLLPKDDPRRIFVVVPFCAFGAMVVHTQISFHFYVLPILFLSGTILAFWFWQVERIAPSKALRITTGTLSENALVKACLIILLLCCSFMLVRFQVSEAMVDRAKTYAKAGDIEGFANAINQAGKWSFERNARALALASTMPSKLVQVNGARMDKGEVLKTLLKSENLLDKALKINPNMASAYHEKALIVEMALRYVPEAYRMHHGGQIPSVRGLLEQSLHYNPLHGGTRVKLAQVMIEQGDKDAAYELLQDGLKWRYLGTSGMSLYQMLMTMSLERGDLETRQAVMRRIKAVYTQGDFVKKRNEGLKEKLGPAWYMISKH